MSIQSFALNRWASGLSPGRPLKIGGGIFTLDGGGGARALGPGSPAAAACIAATIRANKSAPSGVGLGGLGGLQVLQILGGVKVEGLLALRILWVGCSP